MKLKYIVEAKDAIVRLTEKRFTDYKKLREIVRLRKSAEAEFEFYCEQERKAVEAYGEKSDKEVFFLFKVKRIGFVAVLCINRIEDKGDCKEKNFGKSGADAVDNLCEGDNVASFL